jgi:DNA invertase Pin-like site-specific DNA recombinase
MTHPANEPLVGRTYLRKSRPEAKTPDVLAEHRSILARLAANDQTPMPPEHVVEEIGTADNLADRPRFRALLAELQTLPPGIALYCMDIDRLTKGPLPDRAQVYSALTAAQTRIRTTDRWYDLGRPEDLFLFELKAMLGHHENNVHHKRVRVKWDEMTRKGIVLTGTAPFGYRWDRNIRNLVPEPEQFPIVGAMFRDALTQSTYRMSSVYDMRPSSILRILRNPVYTGYPARHCVRHRFQGRKNAVGTRYLDRDEWTWPEQAGTYPAAISRELFERVQVMLKSRHRVGEKTGTTEGWCRDVIEFEGMPGRIDLGSHGRTGNRYLVYQVKGDRRLYVDRAIVHEAATDAILRALAAPGLPAAAVAAREAVARQEQLVQIPEPNREAIRLQIAAMRTQLDDLLIREVAATDSEEAASIARVRVMHRDTIETLQRQLSDSVPPPAESTALPRLLKDYPHLLDDPRGAWRQAQETEKRVLAAAILRRLVVRITPRPHPIPYEREVVLIEYQPWLKTMGKDLADC